MFTTNEPTEEEILKQLDEQAEKESKIEDDDFGVMLGKMIKPMKEDIDKKRELIWRSSLVFAVSVMSKVTVEDANIFIDDYMKNLGVANAEPAVRSSIYEEMLHTIRSCR